MTSKGLFWIWLGPLAWMAILMLVASGRADGGGVESEMTEPRSEPAVRRVVDIEPEPRRASSDRGTELLCASSVWTRPGFDSPLE